jgi:hypothetical protein
MSRNTHNRAYDHHGLDSLSNLELTEFLGPYAPGRTVVDVLTDLLARVTALEAFNGIFPFTLSAVVLKVQSGTFEMGAILAGIFNASAIVLASPSASFTVSAIVLVEQSSAFTLDADIDS